MEMTKKQKINRIIYNTVAILLPLICALGGVVVDLIGTIVAFLIEAYAPYLNLHIKFQDDTPDDKIESFVVWYCLIIGVIDLIIIF